MGNGAEQDLLEALDVEGMVTATGALVATPSWHGDECGAQELVATLAAELGLAVDVWDVDLAALATDPDYSAELPRRRALGVVATLPGAGGGRDLLLDGHVDVVPPGDAGLWSRPPFAGEVAGGRVHGRGATDMKGGLMAGLFAMGALRASGARLAGSVHLASVFGEEDGGSGTLATLLRGWRADGAIVMEPTDLAVCPAQAGVVNFRVRIHGLAAHGAVREEGVSAIDKLFPVYRAVGELEEARNARLGVDPIFARYRLPFPIAVGTLSAGDWASSVPDHLTFEGRMGIAPGEEPDRAKRELEAAVARAAEGDAWLRDHPPLVEWWGGRFHAARTPTDHPLVEAVGDAVRRVTGEAPAVEGAPYGADMGLLAGRGGMPTLLFGPGDIRRAHRPDEYVEIDDLVTAARALILAAARFCG